MIGVLAAVAVAAAGAWLLWHNTRDNHCACARHRIPAWWDRIPAGDVLHERHRCYPSREQVR